MHTHSLTAVNGGHMNNRKHTVLLMALVLLVTTFLSPPVNSQAPPQFSLADGNGHLNADFSNRLSCGPASGSNFYVQGPFITLKLSLGLQGNKSVGTKYYGSWTVRSIFPATEGHPESVTAYYFDGKVESGRVSRSRPENPLTFSLVGRTNSSGLCTPPGRTDTTTRRYVRIYGICGTSQDINFEVSDLPQTDPNNPPTFYASGTFRGDVTCEAGNGGLPPNRIRTNLDRH